MFYVNFDINFLVIKNLNNYIRKFRIKIIGRKKDLDSYKAYFIN